MKILKNKNYIIDRSKLLDIRNQLVQLLLLPNIEFALLTMANHPSERHPVQMGWFTSSYSSCRSCIGY